MYRKVLDNLLSQEISGFVLVSQESFQLSAIAPRIADELGVPVRIIEIDYFSEGPAASVALAEPFLAPELPLVVANCDQVASGGLEPFYTAVCDDNYAGAIVVMEDSDPKWSYVALDDRGYVEKVVEKRVISKFATLGIYGFRRSELYFDGYSQMVGKNDRTNDEFYVAPVYNYLSRASGPVVAVNIGAVGVAAHGLGVPEDYEAYNTKFGKHLGHNARPESRRARE
jgi:NDP-sugar pyrophosphorylase family protein